MPRSLHIIALSTLLLAGTALAQAPAGAPAGSTGVCKDGSYTSTATRKGACRGHKGVQSWFAAGEVASAPAAAAPAAAVTAAAPAAAATAPAVVATPAPVVKPQRPALMGMPTQAAPGGGAGLVWTNASSKVYHCSTDKWYGKTKNGSYMTEADAKAKGFHADHGKACQ